MEKIYIGKTIFEVSSSSKALLEKYVADLKRHILEKNLEIDIYEDIQNRLEEKLLFALESDSKITDTKVKEVINEVGEPDDLFSEYETKSSSKSRRPLYRNSKKGKILGVCYGLGKYFNIEAVRIRLAFLILLFPSGGFIFLLYIILAVVMPNEDNSSEGENDRGDIKTVNGFFRNFFDLLVDSFKKFIDILR